MGEYMDYITASKIASDSFEEKRSEFIGDIASVESEKQALEFIAGIKNKNPQARHIVYAYILRENNMMRYSDAGEPSGTGGQPVLNVLQKEGLTDVCVTVTRYFGGILLGAGGLTRAYAKAAKLAVDASGKALMKYCLVYEICCEYPMYQKLLSALSRMDCFVGEASFAESVTFTVAFAEENTCKILDTVREISADRAKTRLKNEKYIKFDVKKEEF